MTFSSKQLRLLHQNRKRDQVSRFVAGDCFYEDSFVKMIAGSRTPDEDGYRGMSACSRFKPRSEVGA